MNTNYKPPWADSTPLRKGQFSLSRLLLELLLISISFGALRGVAEHWESPLRVPFWALLVASAAGAIGVFFDRMSRFAFAGTLLWVVPYSLWMLARLAIDLLDKQMMLGAPRDL